MGIGKTRLRWAQEIRLIKFELTSIETEVIILHDSFLVEAHARILKQHGVGLTLCVWVLGLLLVLFVRVKYLLQMLIVFQLLHCSLRLNFTIFHYDQAISKMQEVDGMSD